MQNVTSPFGNLMAVCCHLWIISAKHSVCTIAYLKLKYPIIICHTYTVSVHVVNTNLVPRTFCLRGLEVGENGPGIGWQHDTQISGYFIIHSFAIAVVCENIKCQALNIWCSRELNWEQLRKMQLSLIGSALLHRNRSCSWLAFKVVYKVQSSFNYHHKKHSPRGQAIELWSNLLLIWVDLMRVWFRRSPCSFGFNSLDIWQVLTTVVNPEFWVDAMKRV